MRVSVSIVLFIWFLSAAGCISYEAANSLALKYEDLLDFDNSIKYYEKMWYRSKDPEIAKSLALIYLKRREFAKAGDWYAVYNSLSILRLEDHYNNAGILIGNGKYLEAKFHLEKIREKSEEEMYSDLWQSYYRTVTEAPDILKAPTMYELHPFNWINSPYSDFGYSANGNKKFFISDKVGNKSSKKERYGWTGNAYLKVYEGEWNEIGEEFKHRLSEDFIYKFHVGPIYSNSRFQFITINEEAALDKGKKINDGQKVGPRIIYRDKEGPLPFKEKTDRYFEFQNLIGISYSDPYWDEGSGRLYFVSDMSGGFGGLDIYYLTLTPAGTWTGPFNLGKNVNSFGDERSPFVYGDTLYFSSDGWGGLGRLDIYKSYLTVNGPDLPKNMGVPYNSHADDFFFYIDPWLGDLQVLASDRQGGQGLDDLYYLVKSEAGFNKQFFRILDAGDSLGIQDVKLEIIHKLTNEKTALFTDQNGFVSIDYSGQDFVLNVSKEKYIARSFELIDIAPLDTTSIILEKLELNKVFVMKDILYEFGKHEVLPESRVSLRNLATILKSYPQLKVEVRSHTDSRGSDASNQRLSQRRARSAFEFLVNEGIDPQRIRYQGYGSSKPVVDCSAGCREEDHALNRRTEFVLHDN